MDNRQDILVNCASSINSFDTLLPSYSAATFPRYTPSTSCLSSLSTSPNRIRIPHEPQFLNVSQSNLPLRFKGPRSVLSPPNSQRRDRTLVNAQPLHTATLMCPPHPLYGVDPLHVSGQVGSSMTSYCLGRSMNQPGLFAKVRKVEQ